MCTHLADSTHNVGRLNLWSRSFTFDGSDDADSLRLADELGQPDAEVLELQRGGATTPDVTFDLACFFAGHGQGMCAGHTKMKS